MAIKMVTRGEVQKLATLLRCRYHHYDRALAILAFYRFFHCQLFHVAARVLFILDITEIGTVVRLLR